MTNQLIVEALLRAIIRVGSKITSDTYIMLVLNTLIRDLRRDNEVFKYLEIRSAAYSGSVRKITVNPKINTVDKEILGKSLTVFTKRIIAPAGGRGRAVFKTMLESEMGPELVRSIKRLGVEIV